MSIKLGTYASGTIGTLEFTADCRFEVSKEWAEKRAKESNWESLEAFLGEYVYDDVIEWPRDAELAGELLDIKLCNYITEAKGKNWSIY